MKTNLVVLAVLTAATACANGSGDGTQSGGQDQVVAQPAQPTNPVACPGTGATPAPAAKTKISCTLFVGNEKAPLAFDNDNDLVAKVRGFEIFVHSFNKDPRDFSMFQADLSSDEKPVIARAQSSIDALERAIKLASGATVLDYVPTSRDDEVVLTCTPE